MTTPTLALSIRQPWAWLIVRPDLTDPQARSTAAAAGQIKDIENRTWPTKLRGRIFVHAAKTYPRGEHDDMADWMADEFGIALPPYEDIPTGGIVGAVDIVDCVRDHPSRWKMPDGFGFVLANSEPLPFRPLRGALNFFAAGDDIGAKVAHVKAAGQTRAHGCHWPGCNVQVPPAMWGCRSHWFRLPKPIRDDIWRTYRPGQENSLNPSGAYIDAARRAQEWIKENGNV